ncbi:branched-chain amino acid transport system permease protein [Methylobacterium sp. PvP062]|jgi:branched-chain amino acid transport system permease protein|uniref:ABC transporter related n=2 Tax=Methylobacterium radiotolerans TaxID=31998 RepID=B1M8X5_METRJ|nr:MULTISPECIES: branched-chain amino acid ABC transporter ATP-binding protein/permease [Methylobacterium]MCX7333872.1 branched-chain amino acid ABC transporter ATP-binding protein/permease [Hyphomicrobiales bacterium]GAN47286.1 putative ABC transporter [Methylobacterium sp. ME121]ACB27950.1 ABC transporter related [Methylobacterium radiotolerans JCM 2831]MBN6819896.1 branched-chain amino acid ABC transporter ATP-binding protein/permease [Methylobacterium organophilum]MBP2498887.1 branched-cha
MSGRPSTGAGPAAAKPAPAPRRLPLGSLAYAVLAAALVTLAATTPLSGYALNILMQAATYAIAVIGLTVVLGLCGQINLAQAAFFGIGAYAVGLGTVDGGLNFWICLITGLGLAVVLGAALGASTLRLGGHYLAMVTISFQQILTLVLTNWIPVTHGPDGVPNIRRPALFADGQSYLALCVLVLAVVGWLVWHMPRTRLGRAMRAVRDNELAAGVSGIDIYRTKVAAFALGALLAGLGGGLFAGSFTYISPDQFSFAESIVFLTMALLGGVGSPVGAVIGTALLILIPEWLRFLKEIPGLYLAIYGLAVILIVVFMPDGIWGFLGDQVRRLRRARPAPPPAAELTLSQGGASTAPMLEVSDLSKHFGGLKAVDAVSFTVARGGIHALIGPNGSGKTTTLNVLSGLYSPTGGTVRLAGQDVTRLSPHRRAAAGIGRTFQNIRLFRSMSALENVVIGAERPDNPSGARDRAGLEARARAALAFVGLEGRALEPISGFSYGHQRLIEIARALAGNPVLLLLDEPAAGLNSSEKNALTVLLRRMAAKGLTILIIDHDMTLVSDVASHITVLNFGRRIADGVTATVLREPAVIQAYLGEDAAAGPAASLKTDLAPA